MLKNTNHSYGLVHKTIHWVMALFIFVLLSSGFFMSGLAFSPDKLNFYFWHKSFGILILFLVIARVTWRMTNPKPADLPTHKTWEKKLAHFVHFVLYAALFLMPLSGWLMSSAGDFPAPFFGLFDMPKVLPKNENIFGLLREFHGIFAWVILGVVALHIGGALKHHFIDRDETLLRMSSLKIGFWGGALVALAGGFLFLLPFMAYVQTESLKDPATGLIDLEKIQADAAQQQTNVTPESTTVNTARGVGVMPWAIDKQQSSIKFEATQYGTAFEGSFTDFDGQIYFDTKYLVGSYARIEIPIDKIKTGSDDRDAQAQSPDWFDVKSHPKAVFETNAFAMTGPNQYTATGTLTIRGVAVPVTLPFSLIQDEQTHTATMDAELSLNRLDFGIGQGEWKSTETIGNMVKINIHVQAKAQ